MKLLLSLTDQSFHATKSLGIFNVSLGLVRGLMQCDGVDELHILGNESCADAFADCPPHVHVHLAGHPVPGRFSRVWWDQVGVSAAIRRIKPDWAILPKGFPPFFPRMGHTKLACYVHDVIWEYYAGKRGEAGNPFPLHQLLYFRTLGLRALAVSDLVLTSTRFNAGRFSHYAPQARTAVVGIGFDTQAATVSPGGRGRDILFFASPFPHKLTALGVSRLQAWLAQRREAADIRIHVIGSLPESCPPLSPSWIRHGRLSQDELQRLMTGQCKVSAYFSAYEGFGMPPVESLRAGLACVASDIPPIRENIPAEYLFDNKSEESFIRTLNAAYDAETAPVCPAYPTWAQVAGRCVLAMQRERACSPEKK